MVTGALASAVCSLQGAPKAINRSGTRLAGASVPGSSRADTPSSASESEGAHAAGAPGGEYSVLATPSFTPGVEESPFMTWGDLEGTPLRLDPGDDVAVDPGAAQGPQFHVPQVGGPGCLHPEPHLVLCC